jgi:hypothetical protein
LSRSWEAHSFSATGSRQILFQVMIDERDGRQVYQELIDAQEQGGVHGDRMPQEKGRPGPNVANHSPQGLGTFLTACAYIRQSAHLFPTKGFQYATKPAWPVVSAWRSFPTYRPQLGVEMDNHTIRTTFFV